MSILRASFVFSVLTFGLASGLWAQYRSPHALEYNVTSDQQPEQEQEPVVYRGPVLSTALPVTGLYTRGLSSGATRTTGNVGPTRLRQQTLLRSSSGYRRSLNQLRPRPPIVSGHSIARVAVARAIYEGVGF